MADIRSVVALQFTRIILYYKTTMGKGSGNEGMSGYA